MKKPVVLLLLLTFLVVVGAGFAAGLLLLRNDSLPVYAEGELPPTDGYANNTLALGDEQFVSGKAEFRLRPLEEPLAPIFPIGHTSNGLSVYAPNGQTGRDYLFTNGEMMVQSVYRNTRLAPLDLRVMPISEIRLVNGSNSPRRSQDQKLIREVVDTLTEKKAVSFAPDYEHGDNGMRLDLLPKQTPGLSLWVDIVTTTSGQVYLSLETELANGLWIPAGPLFARWTQD